MHFATYKKKYCTYADHKLERVLYCHKAYNCLCMPYTTCWDHKTKTTATSYHRYIPFQLEKKIREKLRLYWKRVCWGGMVRTNKMKHKPEFIQSNRSHPTNLVLLQSWIAEYNRQLWPTPINWKLHWQDTQPWQSEPLCPPTPWTCMFSETYDGSKRWTLVNREQDGTLAMTDTGRYTCCFSDVRHHVNAYSMFINYIHY